MTRSARASRWIRSSLRGLAIAATLLLSSCEEALLGSSPENTPVSNFEILWRDLDRYYPMFGAKHIDWDSLHAVYRSRIQQARSEGEFWNALSELLGELRDPHALLHDPSTGRTSHPGLGPLPLDYDAAMIRDRYLDPGWEALGEGHMVFGRIRGTRVGYLSIFSFAGDDSWPSDIDAVLDRADSLDALVIDIRGNGGGTTENLLTIASAFVDRKIDYLKWAARSGTGRVDIAEPTTLSVTPGPGARALAGKKLVLLVDSYTASSADHFHWLFKRHLPNATTVGEPSCGVFGSLSPFKRLPNGWVFAYSARIAWSMEGVPLDQAGGLVPDSVVINRPADVRNGRDSALQTAISLATSR